MFPPTDFPAPGQLILISDELPSPADFLLNRILCTHLKASRSARALVLSVSENPARWKAIAAKSSVAISTEQCVFVDVCGIVHSEVSARLKPVYDAVISFLASRGDEQKLVILDDISALVWIGSPLEDLKHFSRALRGLCLKSRTALAIRHHIVTPNDPDELFRHLIQLCTYHIDVRPLASGRSGNISGEVALHAGPSNINASVKPIPRSRAVQYRLLDGGAVFFERGTESGLL